MQTKTILYAGGAFIGAMLIATKLKKPTAAASAPATAGASFLYGSSAGQQAMTDQAIAANWTQLQNSVFATQPDFWV